MTAGRYTLIGSTASPYAIKLRALMRYRRIPFDWVIMTKAWRKATAHLRPSLIPVLRYPDGTFRGETTTLAYDLEARHAERSVIPDDKALAFVCDLLEDLADEWAVKPLFLYRWWDPEDQAYVSRWAAEEWSTSDAETGSKKSKSFASGRFRACPFSARSPRTSRCWRRATFASSPRSSPMSA
jgi:glutathione S-transferase